VARPPRGSRDEERPSRAPMLIAMIAALLLGALTIFMTSEAGYLSMFNGSASTWKQQYYQLRGEMEELRNRSLQSLAVAQAERDAWIANYEQAKAERDRWMLLYENMRADRDKWLSEYENMRDDRDKWLSEYENMRADRDKWLSEYDLVRTDRDRFMDLYNRCAAGQ